MTPAELLAAAERLDREGQHALAAEARAEAATPPRPAVQPVTQRCDQCGAVVRSQRQIDHYADVLGVDWVLCARCAL